MAAFGVFSTVMVPAGDAADGLTGAVFDTGDRGPDTVPLPHLHEFVYHLLRHGVFGPPEGDEPVVPRSRFRVQLADGGEEMAA